MTIRSPSKLTRKSNAGRPRGEPTKVVRMPLPIANLARRLAAGTLRAGDINGFIDLEARTTAAVPLVSSTASCGFPSPADDYLDRPLDFNELLVQNPPATFAVQINGDSMNLAGLFHGDIAVVDRSLTPVNGSIILALVDNEFTIKRFCRVDGAIVLLAENPHYPNIEITEESRLEVWGVIKRAIRML